MDHHDLSMTSAWRSEVSVEEGKERERSKGERGRERERKRERERERGREREIERETFFILRQAVRIGSMTFVCIDMSN